jgi:integrase/recombinase XerD
MLIWPEPYQGSSIGLSLLPFRSQRAQPYLYTEEEIRRLLEAAMNLVTPHKLQPWTYHCLFGLLAVSGMRLGEALDLQPHDADWSESLLTIRGAKFGKSVSCLCIHRPGKCC